VKKTLIGLVIAAATTLGSAAFAQAPQTVGPDPTWAPQNIPAPPPPPAQAAAPAGTTYAYAAPAPAAGQWVYTTQYGWVWTPYDASYTYVAGPDVAYTYAYYPRFGWRWVLSPWVLGIGPTPHWGRLGPTRFAWYGHPVNRGRIVVRNGWYARPVTPARPVAPAPRVAWHGNDGNHGDHGRGHRR
jgi:hypothetical protein